MLATHLLDGGPLLYLGSPHMDVCLDGAGTTEAGRALLHELLELSTSNPAFAYSHLWEKGDMLIWDNSQLLHRGCPYENDGTHVREMYQTQARMGPRRSGAVDAAEAVTFCEESLLLRAIGT